MQSVDRYLESVKKCLPAAQADDITKELSENIFSQIEDREAELGRPLTEPEVEAILRQHGHPLVVAGRYRQEQRNFSFGRQIVGPAFFPFYIRVLEFNLGLTSVVVLTIFAALFAGGQPIGNFLQVFFFQLLIQFAIVTLIFWLMDQHFTKFPDRWDSQTLSRVHLPVLTARENGRIPRTKSVSELVCLVVALFWLHAVQHSQFLIFGPAAAFLHLSPRWNQLYVPINLLLALAMINAGITLIRPNWVRFHWLMRTVGGLGNLIVAYFLLARGNLVVMSSLGATPDAARVAQIVNQTIYYCIWFAFIILILQLAKDARRLIVVRPAPPFKPNPSPESKQT